MDIAVAGKAIARVAENIPAEQAKKAIDVAGYYVTPGLVDIHGHVFGYRGSIWPDDTHLTQGVSTVADCGGPGWRTFDEFKQTVIDRATGEMQPWMWEARQRGIIFDVGHGASAFIFPSAYDSIRHGFPPDTLSSDLHNASIVKTKPAMPNVISKFMNFGMTLQEAIYRSTVRPAQAINRFPEVGTLRAGKAADVAVLQLHRGVFGFNDANLRRMIGTRKIEAVLTLRAGELVFDAHGLVFPEWRTQGDYNRIP